MCDVICCWSLWSFPWLASCRLGTTGTVVDPERQWLCHTCWQFYGWWSYLFTWVTFCIPVTSFIFAVNSYYQWGYGENLASWCLKWCTFCVIYKSNYIQYLISDMMHTSNKEKAAKSALVGVSRIHLSLLQVATYSIVLFYFMHSVGHCCLEGAVVCTLYCLFKGNLPCKYYLFLIHAFHNFFNLYHRCWHTYVCINKQCDKKGK